MFALKHVIHIKQPDPMLSRSVHGISKTEKQNYKIQASSEQ